MKMDISQLDSTLTSVKENLTRISQELQFENPIEFILDEQTGKQKVPHVKGLYLFEISTKKDKKKGTAAYMAWFEKTWEDSRYKKKFTPNTRKTRVAFHQSIPDWLPIYIGRSKNIYSRVNQHIFHELEKPTTALKLKARTNMYGKKFRVKIIELEVKNWREILPILEKELRDQINPILGRQ